ncbi:hypothetical protein DHODJN_20940 [Methylorubrum extorquens]
MVNGSQGQGQGGEARTPRRASRLSAARAWSSAGRSPPAASIAAPRPSTRRTAWPTPRPFTLLDAATFKFSTSIAGLFSSLALALTFKVYSIWIEAGFEKFARAIVASTTFRAPQEALQRLQRTSEEQLRQLKDVRATTRARISGAGGPTSARPAGSTHGPSTLRGLSHLGPGGTTRAPLDPHGCRGGPLTVRVAVPTARVHRFGTGGRTRSAPRHAVTLTVPRPPYPFDRPAQNLGDLLGRIGLP